MNRLQGSRLIVGCKEGLEIDFRQRCAMRCIQWLPDVLAVDTRHIIQPLDPTTRQSISMTEVGMRSDAKSAYPVASVIEDWIKSTYLPGSRQAFRIWGFLNRLVLPKVGSRPISQFTDFEMRAVLDNIAIGQRKPASSRLCRMWLRSAMRYARVQKYITRESLADFLDIEPVKHRTTHKAALTPEQITKLWRDLELMTNKPIGLGIRVLLLTFVRPIELMNAHWHEFDLDGSHSNYGPTWNVPADRVKMRTPHIVPLSIEAVSLLRALYAIRCSNQLLFPGGHRNIPASPQAWRDALVKTGWHRYFSLHCCRATASTLMRELDIADGEHIELQLGHLNRKESRASYDFATCLRQRHAMMQRWSSYIIGLVRAYPQ